MMIFAASANGKTVLEMRLVDTDGHYVLKASDNTDYTITFGYGIISVADEAGHILAEFDVDDIPAIDAAQVVRCKRCGHAKWSEKNKAYYCQRHWAMYKCRDRDYCSYGYKRKDNAKQ